MSGDIRLTISDTGILDICGQIEEKCAEIYWYFSRLFADDKKSFELWKKTALEEENHAEQFRLASRLHGSGMKAVNVGHNMVNTMLAKIELIHDMVLKSPPSLKESLRFAIKIEQALAEYHMSTIVSFEDKALEKLFSHMNENDRGHIAMLQHAYDSL